MSPLLNQTLTRSRPGLRMAVREGDGPHSNAPCLAVTPIDVAHRANRFSPERIAARTLISISEMSIADGEARCNRRSGAGPLYLELEDLVFRLTQFPQEFIGMFGELWRPGELWWGVVELDGTGNEPPFVAVCIRTGSM